MKRIILMTLCALFTFSMVYAQDTKKKNNKKETVTFKIDDLDCPSCVKKIEKNLAFEKGVTNLKCDLPTQTVAVTYHADKTDETKLIAAFKKIDMKANVLKEDTENKGKESKTKEKKEQGNSHKH